MARLYPTQTKHCKLNIIKFYIDHLFEKFIYIEVFAIELASLKYYFQVFSFF